MGEKKEGFGAAVPQHGDSNRPTRQIFETPHYRIVVILLSAGPADQPEEMRLRYVVASKEEPVIAGHSGLKGEAIALCLAAEDLLARSLQLAEEQAARNYKPQTDREPLFGHGLGAPNLG